MALAKDGKRKLCTKVADIQICVRGDQFLGCRGSFNVELDYILPDLGEVGDELLPQGGAIALARWVPGAGADSGAMLEPIC